MLFDLRSRGRRRTVQVVYLGLAVLIGGGLILFGVGTGSGTGGLLNAFTGNGSGNAQSQAISQQEKNADKQVKVNPNDAAAWGQLINARWADAATGTNYNSTTGAFSADGKKELAGTTDAWQHYASLTKKPDPNFAELAARAYNNLGNYSAGAGAWEIVSAADPSSAHGFECLAASAYAAKQTRKGDLALDKALSLTPKLSRATLKTQVQAAKTTPSIAASC
jgi:broad specificity polyphosphatase/5'/3'-nucleotidase SurE